MNIIKRCVHMAFIFLALVLALISSHPANAASFDCAGNITNIEQKICASDELSKLDDELAAAFKKVRNYPNVKAGQRLWLK